MVTAAQVLKHSTPNSCWVAIRGQAYDVTEFLAEHPGGPNSILARAGRDATIEYEENHPNRTLDKYLDKRYHLGPVTGDLSILKPLELSTTAKTPSSYKKQPLTHIQNLDEFEHIAKNVASEGAWVYYSSAADSLASYHNNANTWQKVTFRPRILRNVEGANTKQTIFGHESSLPIFAAPAARAKLGHPDGELCIVRGTSHHNIPYCTSNAASIAHSEMAACLKEEQSSGHKGALAWQIYVPRDLSKAASIIQEAKSLGFKALVITLDTVVTGKREADAALQVRSDENIDALAMMPFNFKDIVEVPRGLYSYTLDWEGLNYLRKEWGSHGPVVLKGIQTAEDALLALEAGIDGIYLSNHGGRQLDYAPSSLTTLLEIRKFYPQVIEGMDVYLDGGCRRGSDVVKALCLGATAVGFGRSFMYALTAYGTEGVERAIRVLEDEIQITMRLLGVTKLADLNPNYVNVKLLENELPDRLHLPVLKKKTRTRSKL